MSDLEQLVSETRKSLERVQQYDVEALPQIERLGKDFAFFDAVSPASKTIAIFKKVPTSVLPSLTDSQLNDIKRQADAFFNELNQIEQFDAKAPNSAQTRDSYIAELQGSYKRAFNVLMPIISFAMSQVVDFGKLETEAKAAQQAIKDRADELLIALGETKQEAAEIVAEVRKTAAEQGVSQQAVYFKEEADAELTTAGNWLNACFAWAAILVIYGVVSFFFHKWDMIKPADNAEAIIFVASKILIFAVISFMLILSSKNYMSHKHNATVNRHRQNALQTFNSLAKASGTREGQEIILNHAAACIFAPQDTGYIRGNTSSQPNALDLVTRPAIRLDSSN